MKARPFPAGGYHGQVRQVVLGRVFSPEERTLARLVVGRLLRARRQRRRAPAGEASVNLGPVTPETVARFFMAWRMTGLERGALVAVPQELEIADLVVVISREGYTVMGQPFTGLIEPVEVLCPGC